MSKFFNKCNYLLEIIAFVSGMVVMIYEIIGSRMLAPFLGTSIFVWTSLIGVILASLSLGYYLGGRLVDFKADYKILSLIIFLSAFFIGFSSLFYKSFLFFLVNNFDDLRISSLLATFILFSPASFLLGMVSPYAMRLKIEEFKNLGKVIGSIGALSNLGSIVGTFISGYLLVSLFDTTTILNILVVILFIVSALTFRPNKKQVVASSFFVLVLFGLNFCYRHFSSVINVNTKYNNINIETRKNEKGFIRTLSTDSFGVQGAVYLDNDDLVFDYLKFFRLSEYFKKNIKEALLIGGGVYSYPRDFVARGKNRNIDVVEIDGELVDVSKKYFNFQENSRIKTITQDARIFLNKTKNKYDCIFVDAFNAHLATPFHLTTQEFVQKEFDVLNEGGLIVMNVVSAIEGRGGKFLNAEYHTYKSVFPQVFIFPVNYKDNGELLQNIIMIAVKSNENFTFISDNEELNTYLTHLWEKDINIEEPVLLDEYAPVDYYAYQAFLSTK